MFFMKCEHLFPCQLPLKFWPCGRRWDFHPLDRNMRQQRPVFILRQYLAVLRVFLCQLLNTALISSLSAGGMPPACRSGPVRRSLRLFSGWKRRPGCSGWRPASCLTGWFRLRWSGSPAGHWFPGLVRCRKAFWVCSYCVVLLKMFCISIKWYRFFANIFYHLLVIKSSLFICQH